MNARKYQTKSDARTAVRAVLSNVATPASNELAALVVNRAWAYQETAEEAIQALAWSGVDCEGFEK